MHTQWPRSTVVVASVSCAILGRTYRSLLLKEISRALRSEESISIAAEIPSICSGLNYFRECTVLRWISSRPRCRPESRWASQWKFSVRANVFSARIGGHRDGISGGEDRARNSPERLSLKLHAAELATPRMHRLPLLCGRVTCKIRSRNHAHGLS